MVLLSSDCIEETEEVSGRREKAGAGVESGSMCLKELVCLLNLRGRVVKALCAASMFLSSLYLISQF